MPELPEVETMRRTIDGCIGTRVENVERTACRLKPIHLSPRIDHMRRRLIGRQITETDRAGKRVVIKFDSGDRLVLEPRMTGLVLVSDPPNAEHLRLRIDLAAGKSGRRKRNTSDRNASGQNGTGRKGKARAGNRPPARQLLYWDRRGLGSVRLFRPDEFAATFGLDKLGPDALIITSTVLRERLGDSRRAIKVALLDQRAVAGIGNLYASEILHVAQIDPRKRCDRLRKDDWKRVREATSLVLEEAIRYEGSTLGDGTYRNALNEQGSYQNHHRVYARAGDLCPRCQQKKVLRIVQAQRSTFYCPGCQKR